MSDEITREIIKAIPQLSWPLVVLVIAFVFSKDIKNLIARIISGKILGNEFQFKNEVEKLAEKVNIKKDIVDSEKKEIESLIPKTNIDNKLTDLVTLSSLIEKELRKLLYRTGWFSNIKTKNTKEIINSLVSMGAFPENQKSNVDVFMTLRNKIIHGESNIENQDIQTVIDVGYMLLAQIKAFPTENNFIEYINVDLYEDKDCKVLLKKGKGILLKSISPGNSVINYKLFPTLVNYEKTGIEVSWEWSFETTWGTCYYNNPLTGEKQLAWSSSAEFIGRDIESI